MTATLSLIWVFITYVGFKMLIKWDPVVPYLVELQQSVVHLKSFDQMSEAILYIN